MNRGVLASCKVLGRRLILYESLVGLLTDRADIRPPSAFAQNPRGDGELDYKERPAPRAPEAFRKVIPPGGGE
jgi:hypothetical protein